MFGENCGQHFPDVGEGTFEISQTFFNQCLERVSGNFLEYLFQQIFAEDFAEDFRKTVTKSSKVQLQLLENTKQPSPAYLCNQIA